MYRARIPLAAAAVVLLTTVAALFSVRSTLSSAARAEVQKRVERAQATWPSLDLLRGIDLTNETAKLARDEEFGAVFDKKSSDEQRQAAFVAVSARNGRLEATGRKADLIAVVGANGHVVARDLNINAMFDDDLKGRYPSVGKALDGVANKDVWNFDGHLYRVGAAPIRSRTGAVVGALVIGYNASATDAAEDREKLGTEVAYFLDGKIHASSFKKEGGESAEEKELASSLFDGARLAEGAAAGNLTPPTPVRIGSEDYLAASGPLPGNLTKSRSGYVVLASLTAARVNLGGVEFLIIVLGIIGTVVAMGAAVMTAMRFLSPLDRIETGVAEVINGNREYSFDTPSKDFEGLANALNVMLARLLGRPDPSDDELGASDDGNGQQRWGGELSVESSTTGPQTSPELQALIDEPEEAYLKRTFDEYIAARKQTNEGVEGMTLDGFTQKLREHEAALKKKHGARLVRFKVLIKGGQTTLKPFPIQ
ncbi:MAG TPA: MXAN_5187 C-terminal domain-containing protein [Polyangia bacterium]|nr:MXAN_5187 C-terminal domain-containing protein [Polyangia bacterium]